MPMSDLRLWRQLSSMVAAILLLFTYGGPSIARAGDPPAGGPPPLPRPPRPPAPRGAPPPAGALPSFAEPAISPDKSEVAFCSAGDIWTVPARGGEARLLV